MMRRLGWALLLVFCFGSASLLPGSLTAQTLAHKGWAGSGLTIDPWWKGAVFYELDPLAFPDLNGNGSGDLNGITQHLDYLQGLGVDAILLSPFSLQAPGKNGGAPFASSYNAEEDFDKLEQQASLRKMRVLVDLPLGANHSREDTLALARFWLSRGAGGLRLVADPTNGTLEQAEAADRVRQLRRLCAGYVGDRVLIWDVVGAYAPGYSGVPAPAGTPAHPVSRRRRDIPADGPQLTVDHAAAAMTAWNATTMRALVSGAVSPTALLVSDAAGSVRSWKRLSEGMTEAERLAVAKMLATVMLTVREAPMLLYGQEIGLASSAAAQTSTQWAVGPASASGQPPIDEQLGAGTGMVAAENADSGSLLHWYRKLSALRQEGLALKDGTLTLIDTGYPDVVAWVRKGSTAGERPVLVMCNLSGRGALIPVEQQLRQIGLKPASGMRPLALSFTGENPSYTATGINLPPYGIYLGEIVQPGLEDSPAPYVSRRRGR
jgi:alpha-glucosidase